ncbi:hypothetical protein IKJ53_05220 [bacterium]|nr:hypothetical protein [bacterium]
MGILASTMRLMVLTNTKNDLDFRMMGLAEKMACLTARIAENNEFYSELDPNSPEAKELQTYKEELNLQEKQLEQQQKMLEAQLQQVTQEMQACQQYLGQSIKSSGFFSYGLGGG